MDTQEQELEKIEKLMSRADFWQKDQEEISQLNQQRASLREIIDQWQGFYHETEDARILAEMAFEESDNPTLKEVDRDVDRLQTESNPKTLHASNEGQKLLEWKIIVCLFLRTIGASSSVMSSFSSNNR